MSNTFILLFSIDLVMLAFFLFMPVMRGEDAFFGVRVSTEVYRGEGRRILHRYWLWLLMTFGVSAAIFSDFGSLQML